MIYAKIGAPKGKRGASMPILDRARQAVAPLMDAGARINTRKLGKEIGVSHVKIDEAIAAEKARRDAIAELKAELPPIDPSTLPKTAQDKLAAVLRQQQRKADAQYAARMRALDEEVSQRIAKEVKTHHERLMRSMGEHFAAEERYRALINNHNAIFTKDEFIAILKCLHPDNSASPETRAEGFRLFNARKLQLTKEQ